MNYLIVRKFTSVNISRLTGSKEGDRNTKFFHARASERRKQNTILGIWDKSENWCGDQDSIARAAVSYFDEIYSTSSLN